MKCLLFAVFLSAYFFVSGPVKEHLDSRPLVIKLGFMPRAEVVKTLSGDQAHLMSEWYVLKVLFYFGSLVEQWKNQILLPPEYFNMFKTIETAVKLDPYNSDAYYFAQAAFTWEVGRAADVNRLLEYGMLYRDWDPNLFFYAGFNAGFFLEDYEKAATYMQRAGELSGMAFYSNLASRYFYEAGRNELGVAFLKTMSEHSNDPMEKRIYGLRIGALQATAILEDALASYVKRIGKSPDTLIDLVKTGDLEILPEDPYGGEFYLDPAGRVRTTSNFAVTDKVD